MARLVLFALILFALGSNARAQELTVAVSDIEPFVTQQPDGSFVGYDIELWEEAARRSDISEYSYVRMPLTEKLDAIKAGRAQVALGSLTVNAQREQAMDFTTPYMAGGLALARVKPEEKNLVWAIVTDPNIWKVFLVFVIYLVISGVIFWLTARGNENIADEPRKGIADGTWLAFTTGTTIGYGDVSPARWFCKKLLKVLWLPGDRMAAIPIAFVGFIITAMVITTVNEINIRDSAPEYQSLQGISVGVKEGSTGSEVARTMRASRVRFETSTDALQALKDGEVQLMMFDRPFLRAAAADDPRIEVLPQQINREFYAFAVHGEDPDLREKLNLAIAELRENGFIDHLDAKYFGH